MKRVLLLGGYGFIGTNILKYADEHLLAEYQFIVFDRVPLHIYGVTFSSVEKTYYGDFSSRSDIERIFIENQIDIIIHSLSSTVPTTSLDPKFDIESNLLSTLQLLEIQAKYQVPQIIYLSSGGAIYGNDSRCAFTEDHFSNPISSYGIIKLAIEKYLYLYHMQYGFDYLILRLSNPYGPFHYSQKQGVINIALESALMNKPFSVWGDGEGGKDYIYIQDFCRVLFGLINKKVLNTVLNVGSGVSTSLNTILNIINLYYPEFTWTYTPSHQNDIVNFSLNINRLRNFLPDIQFSSIDQGISKTLNWIHNERTII